MTKRRTSAQKLQADISSMNYTLRRWMVEPWKDQFVWSHRYHPKFDELVLDLKTTTGIDYPVESKNEYLKIKSSEEYKKAHKDVYSGKREGIALHVLFRWNSMDKDLKAHPAPLYCVKG
jgi:hypothetical protein